MKLTTLNSRFKIKLTNPIKVKPTGFLCAGAYRIDITPPPGMPVAGYSVISEGPAKGSMMKLFAKAFYLEDKDGNNFVMINADLMGGSLIIHHLVGNILAEKIGVSLDRLMITSTHTHSAPAQYFDSGFYNMGASNKSGFDEKWVDFLVEKLSLAAIMAYTHRKKAKIASGITEIHGLTRNRSIPAHAANFKINPDELDIHKEIDPVLTLMRIDCLANDGKYVPYAAFHNFSIHGTAVSERNDLYTSDNQGAAERYMMALVKQQYGLKADIIYGISNGNSGNMSPDWQEQTHLEAERIGREIAYKSFDLYQSLDDKLIDDISIQHFYKEVPMLNCPETDPALKPASRALVGWQETIGADDGRSFMFKLGVIKEFDPRNPPKGEHTYKKPILNEAIQKLIFKAEMFPCSYALQTAIIGNVMILALPNEVTIEMGKRIRKAALEKAKTDFPQIEHVIISSVTNQYAGYLTTPEEYSMQSYEGASNLYGENTGPYISSQFEQMIDEMIKKKAPSYPADWDFLIFVRDNFFVEKEKNARANRKLLVQPIIHDERISIIWQDLGPGNIDFDRPLIKVQRLDNDDNWTDHYVAGIPVSDQGTRIELRYLGNLAISSIHRWKAIWHFTDQIDNGKYRFIILPRYDKKQIVSNEFSLNKSDTNFLESLENNIRYIAHSIL